MFSLYTGNIDDLSINFTTQSSLTADHIVLAVGGRPRIPENVSNM